MKYRLTESYSTLFLQREQLKAWERGIFELTSDNHAGGNLMYFLIYDLVTHISSTTDGGLVDSTGISGI